jgi:hypothetical protein
MVDAVATMRLFDHGDGTYQKVDWLVEPNLPKPLLAFLPCKPNPYFLYPMPSRLHNICNVPTKTQETKKWQRIARKRQNHMRAGKRTFLNEEATAFIERT